jgi:hypothetical protein
MRIIEVADEREMDDKIYYYARRRYTVKTQTERNVVMSEKPWFLLVPCSSFFTFTWTF